MFLHKGLFEDALQHFQQAQKNLHYINDAVVEIFVMGQLALTQIRLGNLTSAHQLADELLRKLLADKFTGYGITGYGFLEGYPSLVEVYLAVWQSEQIDIEPLKLEKKSSKPLRYLIIILVSFQLVNQGHFCCKDSTKVFRDILQKHTNTGNIA